MTGKIFGIVAVIALLAVLFFSLKVGLEKTERNECLKWRQEAREYPLWYSTQWQREQCLHYNLPLPK